MSGEKIIEAAKDFVDEETDKLADTLREFGSGLPGEDANQPFKMPTKEELLAMLDSMGLADNEKDELRAALLSGDPIAPPKQPWTTQAFILMFFLAFVASLIALIGYRLYKSMKDKEFKKEEKRSKKEEKRLKKIEERNAKKPQSKKNK